MIKEFSSILVFMVFLTAYSHKDTASYTLDKAITEYEANLINKGIGVLEGYQEGGFMHSQNPDIRITLKFGELDGDTVGLAEVGGDECNITIENEINPSNYTHSDPKIRREVMKQFKVTLIHEIGHCFGLEHDEGLNEIMSPYYNSEAATQEAFDRFNEALRRARKGL
jgi:predicted Zn-dependent protease